MITRAIASICFGRNTSVVLLLMHLLSACSPYTDAPQSIDNQRFVKLDHKGSRLPATALRWSCTQDTQTGLVWENKSDNEGSRHYSWTYSWNDQAGAARRLSATTEGSCNKRDLRHCTTQAYVQHLNRNNYCGRDSWRLPQIDELASILSKEPIAQGKAYCDCYFNPAQAHLYWSSSLEQDAEGRDGIQALHFGTAQTQVVQPDNYLYLRLVAESLH